MAGLHGRGQAEGPEGSHQLRVHQGTTRTTHLCTHTSQVTQCGTVQVYVCVCGKKNIVGSLFQKISQGGGGQNRKLGGGGGGGGGDSVHHLVGSGFEISKGGGGNVFNCAQKYEWPTS